VGFRRPFSWFPSQSIWRSGYETPQEYPLCPRLDLRGGTLRVEGKAYQWERPLLRPEPGYTVQRGPDLLWILEFFILRDSGREALKLASPLTSILRTSNPSGAWRGPRGWPHPQPPHLCSNHRGWGRDPETTLIQWCPPVWRLNSFDKGKIVFSSHSP